MACRAYPGLLYRLGRLNCLGTIISCAITHLSTWNAAISCAISHLSTWNTAISCAVSHLLSLLHLPVHLHLLHISCRRCTHKSTSILHSKTHSHKSGQET